MRTKLINFLKKTFIKNLYDNNSWIKSLLRYIYWITHIVTRSTEKQRYSINSYHDYLRSYNPQKLLNLKDIHLGEMCFVIGNGPSLTSKDLHKIREFTTFGSNYIFEINSFLPNYYFVQDFYHLKNKQLLNKIREVSPQTSFTFLPFNLMFNRSKKNMENVVYYYVSPPKENTREFSFDISQNVVDGWTVTYSILQFAIYMGFKNIYLLGMDNTFPGHFYDSDINTEICIKPNELTNRSYQYLKSVLPTNTEIVNCTDGGALEVFERMSLDQVLNYISNRKKINN